MSGSYLLVTNHGYRSRLTRLNAAGLSEIEPDLNEDPVDRWATNGVGSEDFKYGEMMGTIHTMKEKRKRRKGKLPPGPPKLPILGNLHQLGALPHRSLGKLSKKHGSVMLLQLGATPTLIVSSAETAREVLKIHDRDSCSRPALAGAKRHSYNFLDLGFAPYGYYWREVRKICVIELFSMKRVQSFQSVREEEVNLLINSISESATLSSPVDLSKEFFSLAASIIFRTAFGKTFQGSELDND
ncbi:hypothetical protein PTKIN_Ptkin02bG0075700 [Pterospermum kingtungense]